MTSVEVPDRFREIPPSHGSVSMPSTSGHASDENTLPIQEHGAAFQCPQLRAIHLTCEGYFGLRKKGVSMPSTSGDASDKADGSVHRALLAVSMPSTSGDASDNNYVFIYPSQGRVSMPSTSDNACNTTPKLERAFQFCLEAPTPGDSSDNSSLRN